MDLSTDLPLLVASAAAALLGTLLLFGGKSSGRTILLTRRSHVKYAKKKVPQAAVDRALEAAILAPNHFLSEPWRFYQCGAETIKKFAALNADKADACLAVPGMMVVTLTSKHKLDEKLGLEDHAAVRSAASTFFRRRSFAFSATAFRPPGQLRGAELHAVAPRRGPREQVDDGRHGHRAGEDPRGRRRARGREDDGRRLVRLRGREEGGAAEAQARRRRLLHEARLGARNGDEKKRLSWEITSTLGYCAVFSSGFRVNLKILTAR